MLVILDDEHHFSKLSNKSYYEATNIILITEYIWQSHPDYFIIDGMLHLFDNFLVLWNKPLLPLKIQNISKIHF